MKSVWVPYLVLICLSLSCLSLPLCLPPPVCSLALPRRCGVGLPAVPRRCPCSHPHPVLHCNTGTPMVCYTVTRGNTCTYLRALLPMTPPCSPSSELGSASTLRPLSGWPSVPSMLCPLSPLTARPAYPLVLLSPRSGTGGPPQSPAARRSVSSYHIPICLT